MGNGRNPQNINKVPFQEILPLALKDRVSGKGDKTAELACLPEMQALFSCFKKHDFEQTKCLSEVDVFRKCYEEFRRIQYINKKHKQSDVLVPGAKLFTSKQLNTFLRKFPQPR